MTLYPSFSTEKCNTLFAEILVNDHVDLNVELCSAIHIDYSQEQLTQCYRISQQLWEEGVDRKTLIKLVNKLYRQRVLGPEDQLAFKHMRYKFKHLRFAYATLDYRYRYPPYFHGMTTLMGKLQDAFKNEKDTKVGYLAILLRILLSKFLYNFCTRDIERFQLGTLDGFREYVNSDIHFVRSNLAKDGITAKIFHEMRKVISRQVALYANLKVLYPSPYHCSIFHYLSTINGMMGNMHDTLITRKFEKPLNYYIDTFAIPEEIKQRLITYTDKYGDLQ